MRVVSVCPWNSAVTALFTAEEDTALAVNISHGVYMDIYEKFVHCSNKLFIFQVMHLFPGNL